jgi:hypothetical protein
MYIHTYTIVVRHKCCQNRLLSLVNLYYVLILLDSNTERGYHSGIANACYVRDIKVNIKSTVAVMFKTFARSFAQSYPVRQ